MTLQEKAIALQAKIIDEDFWNSPDEAMWHQVNEFLMEVIESSDTDIIAEPTFTHQVRLASFKLFLKASINATIDDFSDPRIVAQEAKKYADAFILACAKKESK